MSTNAQEAPVEKRDRLMHSKIAVDEELASAKIDLDEAKARAAANGVFLSPEKYSAMRRHVAALQRESQRLQLELRGDRKAVHAAKDKQTVAFLQEFFLTARRHLTREQYASLCKEAENRLNLAANGAP